MKIQRNFLFNTNYVNHNRTEVDHDNFFQWKMRYQLNRLVYNNAGTYNNDKSSIALKAIEKNIFKHYLHYLPILWVVSDHFTNAFYTAKVGQQKKDIKEEFFIVFQEQMKIFKFISVYILLVFKYFNFFLTFFNIAPKICSIKFVL